MPLIPPDDPRLQPYRDIGPVLRREPPRVFVAEGEKIMRRLWASDFVCDGVLVSEKKLDRIAADIPATADVLVVSDETMKAVLGFKFHSGMMATGVRRPWPTVGGLLGRSAGPGPDVPPAAARRDVVLVLPEITDPLNLGAILRNAAAFGVAGVVLGPHCRDPLSRQTVRTSMGTIFTLPLAHSADLVADLAALRAAGYEAWATVLADDAEPLHRVAVPDRVALLLGNEGPGLPPELTAAADRRVTVPMHNGTDSLNVAAASAVFLYAVGSRQ